MNEHEEQQLNAALDAWFRGDATQVDACDLYGVSIGAFRKAIAKARCNDFRCIMNPCRAAKCSSERIVCTALSDTNIKGMKCPFYKTAKEFYREYSATDKMEPERMKELGYDSL